MGAQFLPMVSSGETTVVAFMEEVHKTLTISRARVRARECIKAAPFNQPRTIDRAIIGGGVLIGTISFIAAIPGASFRRGEGPAALQEGNGGKMEARRRNGTRERERERRSKKDRKREERGRRKGRYEGNRRTVCNRGSRKREETSIGAARRGGKASE